MPSDELVTRGALARRLAVNAATKPLNVAVLGTLFRSRDYLNGESELVVIVTPYIVSATAPGKLQTPADGLQVASDAETILMGKLNHAYKVTPPAGRTYQGPYGHVID